MVISNSTESYQDLVRRIFLKSLFLHSHLDCFVITRGDVSEEHGERFHQGIQVMEKPYQRKLDEVMMGDYM